MAHSGGSVCSAALGDSSACRPWTKVTSDSEMGLIQQRMVISAEKVFGEEANARSACTKSGLAMPIERLGQV